MFYKAISDGVVLQQKELTGTSKGGILVPPSKKARVGYGTVVDVGPGRVTDCGREPMDVKVGDVVLYERSAAMEVDNYIVVPQGCIFAVCKEDGQEFKPGPQLLVPDQKIHTISPTLN
jgi:co-chaperonin GroES (HSP10)